MGGEAPPQRPVPGAQNGAIGGAPGAEIESLKAELAILKNRVNFLYELRTRERARERALDEGKTGKLESDLEWIRNTLGPKISRGRRKGGAGRPRLEVAPGASDLRPPVPAAAARNPVRYEGRLGPPHRQAQIARIRYRDRPKPGQIRVAEDRPTTGWPIRISTCSPLLWALVQSRRSIRTAPPPSCNAQREPR